jgi:hypothetical protein
LRAASAGAALPEAPEIEVEFEPLAEEDGDEEVDAADDEVIP